MKRILINILIISALFTLTACGSKKEDLSNNNQKQEINKSETKQEENNNDEYIDDYKFEWSLN